MKMGTTFLTCLFLLWLVLFPVPGLAQQETTAETQEKPESETFPLEQPEPTETPAPTPAPTPDPALQPLDLGKIFFPRDFLHAQKEYKRGVYLLKLISKDGLPYFQVYNPKGELLIEEMGILRDYKTKSKNFKFRLMRSVLNDYEYLRVIVLLPGQKIYAHFLLKQPAVKAETQEKSEDLPEKKEEVPTEKENNQ